nr:2-iminoacetate synthase ThiH [Fusobacteriaceae bacterium]
IEVEAIEIAKTGIKHILLLTGEAQGLVDLEYIKNAVKVLKKHFAAVSIEIYPLEEFEYKELQEIGVHGLTIYQETYNEELYDKVHLSGKKKDYNYRLDCPERGAKAKLNSVTIGPLFGLGSIKEEAFFAGLHAKYLQDNYLETEFSVSLPRMNAAEGAISEFNMLDDISYVQIMLAYRLFMPKIGINLSTRETAKFRDKVLNLGVTKFSAGSKTNVGGYSGEEGSTAQFEISDDRSVSEIVTALKSYGRDIIFKDWELIK